MTAHVLGWDAAARAGTDGGAAVAVFTCPDCEFAGTVTATPPDGMSQLVKAITVLHRAAPYGYPAPAAATAGP